MNESRRTSPSVVILTALDVEYRAVRDRIHRPRPAGPVSGTLFETGSLEDGGTVVLALTGQGNHASAIIAERAIGAFNPMAVLFAGVAGALRPSLALGDIIIATHVYAYHGAAARPGGLRSRPRVWEIDHGVDQTAHQIARRPGMPRTWFGPVASGEVLHDAAVSEPLRWLREHYEDALAIEMEAAGVAKAGHLRAAPIAVVRAISDRADGTKSGTDHDGWQATAAGNAAAFAVALAAGLIAQREAAGLNAQREAAESPDEATPAVHVETHGGRHDVVAGIINGGVHNDLRGSR